MRLQNIKFIYIKNIILFLIFGLIIATGTSYIQYNIKYEEIQKKLDNDSLVVSSDIKMQIQDYVSKVELCIDSLETNRLFTNYLIVNNKDKKEIVDSLFINSMENNKNFFQLRFIDKNGLEKIRIDKDKNSNAVFIVPNDKLQDKSDRYYFKDTIEEKENKFWYSNIDLNIEHGKLEQPLRPTFRVSKKVFYKGKLYGILVVNIEMKPLFEKLRVNNQFDMYIIDKDGYYIVNPDRKKDFSRYLNKAYTINSDFPKFDKNISNTLNGFIFPLDKYINNGENLKLILKVKADYLNNIKNNNLSLAYTIGLLTLLISIPIGLIISIPTSKLHMEFTKVYKENQKHVDIIDKYVITMTVDLNKKITGVSSALCNISGYSKDELLGENPSILKSGNLDTKVYKSLWEKISNGKVWVGELENKTKSGMLYWLKTTILPSFDDNKIDSYISIGENINDKKIIEKISQMDKLTQVYNRIKIDKSLDEEMKRFKRNKFIFSILLIDVDHFKLVNDTYGHQVGDKVLIEVSNILKKSCRNIDIVGRWGGEEFLIICQNTHIEGAMQLAQKIKDKIENFEFDTIKHLTVSIGLSQVNETDSIETFIKRVDNNLYSAKKHGRNKIVSDFEIV
ncbi:MAG: diguanylate cyclase [Halarcobacter sp.]